MTLRQHATLTAAASLFLLPFWNWTQLLLFSAGSVLIDVDHYLLYVWRRKRLGIADMFEYHQELFTRRASIPYAGICIFHTVDFFALCLVLALWFPLLWYLLAGLVFHFLLDVLFLLRHDYALGRAYFVLEHYLRKRRHPRYPYF